MAASSGSVKLVVVGSLGLDTVETPRARRVDVLGGSVSYACASAAFFAPVGMVGVVGTDFPVRHVNAFKRFGIDLRGLQTAEGKTFRWSGVYEQDMNNRRTLSTELNVFGAFAPELPAAYRAAPYLFLANIHPELQLRVLGQVRAPRFIAADTMDLWIRTTPRALRRMIAKVDLLLLNDSEARQLTGEAHLLPAAHKVLAMGPRYLIVKKGEHGSMLFSREGIFLAPAYPLHEVHDPTGAGDAFAGGLMGCLAREGRITPAGVRRAMFAGAVVASFTVEAFSLEKLARIGARDVVKRLAALRRMTAV